MTDGTAPPTDGVIVRVYCTADDRLAHRALIAAVTGALADAGALEVTVLRATKGFGRAHRIHDVDAVDSGMNHPLVVEWVDTPAGFERTWPGLRPMVADTLVTLERVVLTGVTPAHSGRAAVAPDPAHPPGRSAGPP